jgi:transposase
LSDQELQERLYPPQVAHQSRHLEPNCAYIHQELRRPGVTLQLLWEEYQQKHQGQAYRYSAFCDKYKAWAGHLKLFMRQTHLGGQKLFVDYAGQTVPIVDAATGEISQAQIFVAVLGASNYTYACATASQKACDWAASIIAALEFIGGVPRLLVPDQPRALMARPDRYEPTPHSLLDELCAHYNVAVLPARPAHPRDKPKVEVGVQVVERWILARLRNQSFFSLTDLNGSIAALLSGLNQRPFKKLPGCRASAFAQFDVPLLHALPATRMAIARFKTARVSIDYGESH